MSTFTVKYRTNTGGVAEEVIEAESRTAAFAELKARGIVPISVSEGGTRRAPRKESAPERSIQRGGSSPKLAVKGAIAGLLVVAMAVGCWFWLSSSQKPMPQKPEKPVARSKPAAPQPVAQPKPVVTNQTPAVAEKPTEPERDESIPVSVTTNKSGYITEVYIQNGKRRRVIKEPPPIFNNAADQLIAWMMSAPAGQELPPFPIDKSINEDFKNSLTNKITILPTDDEKVAAMKQAVLETRIELLKLIEKGMTVEEALKEHRDLVNENAKIRTNALLEMKKIHDSGDIAGTAKYVTEMNKAFRQMGIQPLTIPGTGEKRPRGPRAADGQDGGNATPPPQTEQK